MILNCQCHDEMLNSLAYAGGATALTTSFSPLLAFRRKTEIGKENVMVGDIVHREVAEPIYRDMLREMDDAQLEAASQILDLATGDRTLRTGRGRRMALRMYSGGVHAAREIRNLLTR